MKNALILLISAFHIHTYSSAQQCTLTPYDELSRKTACTPLSSPDYAGLSASNRSFTLSSDSQKTDHAVHDLQNELAIIKAALISCALKDHNADAQRVMSQERQTRKALLGTFQSMQRASIQRQERTNWCNFELFFQKETAARKKYLRNLYANRRASLEVYNNHVIDRTALCQQTGDFFDTKTMRTVHPQPTEKPSIEFVKK